LNTNTVPAGSGPGDRVERSTMLRIKTAVGLLGSGKSSHCAIVAASLLLSATNEITSPLSSAALIRTIRPAALSEPSGTVRMHVAKMAKLAMFNGSTKNGGVSMNVAVAKAELEADGLTVPEEVAAAEADAEGVAVLEPLLVEPPDADAETLAEAETDGEAVAEADPDGVALDRELAEALPDGETVLDPVDKAVALPEGDTVLVPVGIADTLATEEGVPDADALPEGDDEGEALPEGVAAPDAVIVGDSDTKVEVAVGVATADAEPEALPDGEPLGNGLPEAEADATADAEPEALPVVVGAAEIEDSADGDDFAVVVDLGEALPVAVFVGGRSVPVTLISSSRKTVPPVALPVAMTNR